MSGSIHSTCMVVEEVALTSVRVGADGAVCVCVCVKCHRYVHMYVWEVLKLLYGETVYICVHMKEEGGTSRSL